MNTGKSAYILFYKYQSFNTHFFKNSCHAVCVNIYPIDYTILSVKLSTILFLMQVKQRLLHMLRQFFFFNINLLIMNVCAIPFKIYDIVMCQIRFRTIRILSNKSMSEPNILVNSFLDLVRLYYANLFTVNKKLWDWFQLEQRCTRPLL